MTEAKESTRKGEGGASAKGDRLGPCVHEFRRRPRPKKTGRRQLEILGVASVIMVPVGLGLVEGTIGYVVAALGGIVAVMAYVLSSRGTAPPETVIRICEGGVEASHGDASRAVLWNEVVDVAAHRLPTADGKESLAVVLEVVGTEPLLIVVGGAFSDVDKTGQMIKALGEIWLPIWCRRARAQLEQNHAVQVGLASLSLESFTLGDRCLTWSDVQGVEKSTLGEALRTRHGVHEVEESAQVTPFPSSARRLNALASAPTSRYLLPPADNDTSDPAGPTEPGDAPSG